MRTQWTLPTTALAGLLALFGATDAMAAPRRPNDPKKIDRALKTLVDDPRGSDEDTVPVIVKYKEGARDQVADKLAKKGAAPKNHVGRKGLVADVHKKDLADLVDSPDVEGVSLDAKVKNHQRGSGNGNGNAFGLVQSSVAPDALREMIGLTAGSPTGAGIGVAVVDTGIRNTPDFNITAFYDFTRDGRAQSVLPTDNHGHGTHVAGLIGNNGSQTDKRFLGVAPGVRLIGLKVLDDNGAGRTSDVIAAIDFAVENRRTLGINVINLSLGHPIYESAETDPLVQAVEDAVAAGIVVVASAGNHGMDDEGNVGYAGIESPGNAPSALTVGSTKTFDTIGRGDDQVSDFSSRGPTLVDAFAKPDLVAPGQRLVSSAYDRSQLFKEHPEWVYKPSFRTGGRFIRLSGSSMSTGVVSGVVAVLLEANANQRYGADTPMAPLTPYDIKTILEYTATPLADTDVLSQGAGQVNAAGALELLDAIDTRWSPRLVGPTSGQTTFGGQTETWSKSIIWGGGMLTDALPQNLIQGSHIVWGDHIVRGNSTGDDTVGARAWSCVDPEACF
jgi:serine protease AprX